MASYIAIFLCLVCIILLLILLFKFKKLFSTDAIIEKTRIQMNKMITDINKNTKNDIDLINESSRRVRSLLSEGDQRMEQFKIATERLREMISIVENMEKSSGINYYVENQKVSNIKPIGQKKNDIFEKSYNYSEKIDPNTTIKVNKLQSSLFEEENEAESKILKDEINVTSDGAAYKQVPVINAKLFEEQTIINKTEKEGKYLKNQILRLFNQGMNAEDIAQKLSCSVGEVQFIINFI